MNDVTVELKVVVDNVAAKELMSEHGLSIWLRVDSHTILFDTGQGGSLLNNARKLKIDLSKTDTLILSHGHYDHTGGLPAMLHLAPQVQVYCHSAAFLPRYSIENSVAKPVKITAPAMASINSLPEDRLHWVSKKRMITDAIGITGEIPRMNDFETTGGTYCFDLDGKRVDSIVDDLALWVATDKGLVICIGCCHAGIVNTLTYIQQITGEKRIHTVIGGLHQLNDSDDNLTKTMAALSQMDIGNLIPCHCTSEEAHLLLEKEIGCTRGFAGLEFTI